MNGYHMYKSTAGIKFKADKLIYILGHWPNENKNKKSAKTPFFI